MTFMTLAEAKEACKPESDLYEDALNTMQKAYEALETAREAYDDAGGALDDSTFWDIVGVVGVVAACVIPEPSSKALCVTGIIGGGATVTASELDRQDEINAAEQAVQAAEVQYEMAQSQAIHFGIQYNGCLFHHLSKGD